MKTLLQQRRLGGMVEWNGMVEWWNRNLYLIWIERTLERWNVRTKQDGATHHTSDRSLDVLWEYFEDRVISNRFMEQYACILFAGSDSL